MNKVFRVQSWMEQDLTLVGSEEKAYTAKRTGLKEVVNFIQSNDRHGDMVDYYNEVLAGDADPEEFAIRLEEYLMDVAQQNKEAGLHTDNRLIWKYLKVVNGGIQS